MFPCVRPSSGNTGTDQWGRVASPLALLVAGAPEFMDDLWATLLTALPHACSHRWITSDEWDPRCHPLPISLHALPSVASSRCTYWWGRDGRPVFFTDPVFTATELRAIPAGPAANSRIAVAILRRGYKIQPAAPPGYPHADLIHHFGTRLLLAQIRAAATTVRRRRERERKKGGGS